MYYTIILLFLIFLTDNSAINILKKSFIKKVSNNKICTFIQNVLIDDD